MQMNFIWRFYRDPDHRWKWQRLSADRTVVAESSAAYKEYEGCLADAREHGHVFHPSHARFAHGRSN
jgi:hypothetical protein